MIIQRAEGEREAVIQVAQVKAESIRLVNEAAERYFRQRPALKRMEMIENSAPERQDHHHRARHPAEA